MSDAHGGGAGGGGPSRREAWPVGGPKRGGGLMEERGGAEFWDGCTHPALPLLMAGWVLEAGEKSVS